MLCFCVDFGIFFWGGEGRGRLLSRMELIGKGKGGEKSPLEETLLKAVQPPL